MFNFFYPPPFLYKAAACLAAVLIALGFAAPSAQAQTLPTLSLSGPSEPVKEGENANFTITLTPPAGQGLLGTVTYTVTLSLGLFQNSPRISPRPTTVIATFTAADLTHDFTLSVVNNNDVESFQFVEIPVSIQSTDRSTYEVHTSEYTVTLTIEDDDKPTVSVLGLGSGPFIFSAGDTLMYLLTTGQQRSSSLTVAVNVDDPGGYIMGAAPTNVVIPADEISYTLSIATEDDNTDKPDNTVTVSLPVPETDALYLRDDNASSITYTVTRDDTAPTQTLPVLSLSGPSEPVREGEDANFTLTLTPPAGQEIQGTVTYTVALSLGLFQNSPRISPRPTTVTATFTAADPTHNFTLNVAENNNADSFQFVEIPVSIQSTDTSTYEVHPVAYTVTLTVEDVDKPFISVLGLGEVPFIFRAGDTLMYLVSVGQERRDPLTVAVNVDDPGGYIAGDAPTEVVIPPGQTNFTLTIATEDDNTDKPDNTVTVSLPEPETDALYLRDENASGITYTVTRDDTAPLEEENKAVLPQVAVATAMQITGAVSGRIDTVFNRTAENDLSVRGKNWKQFLASEAEKARGNERAELPDLDLNLSDFAFSIAADGDEWGGGDSSSGGALDNLGIWGRGYYAGVDVKEAGDMNNVNFDGSIVGGMIGADVLLNDKVVTGVGVNFSKSGVDFQTGESSGTHDTTVWSFHPYIGLKAGPKVTLYATAGYGFGSLEAMETGGGDLRENDVSLLTGGAGGKGTVYGTKAGAWDVKVNVLGDFVYAQLSEDGGIDASGGIFRGGLEVAGANKGGAGASLELAYRADFGDTVGGSGLEVGGGLRFGSPSSGISVNLDGRILAYHSEELSEYGFSGDVSWSRGKTGPYAKFSPTWGAVNDRRDDLWENGANGWSEADSSGRRYNFEAGYGVGLPEEAGIMKLFARSEMEDGETVFRSGGVDVEVGSGLTAGYETVDHSGATVEHRGYVRFGGAF